MNLFERPVYFYTHTPIVPFGSGTQIRQFTNVRAYVDLGMRVEVIHITNNLAENKIMLPTEAIYCPIKPEVVPLSWRQRIAYKIGFPFEDILQTLYPDRQTILRTVLEHERATPGALHHFEYPATANVAVSLRGKGLNLVWSCHDWESDRNRKVKAMREEAGQRKSWLEKVRRQQYARMVEKRIADSCKLVLMIAEHETRVFHEQLNIKNAEFFPTSWSNETMPARARDWMQEGALRMMHVGSPDAMVGYYSLKFILGEVFPCIPEHFRQRMELWIAGKTQDTSYSHTIHRLAQPYPQVKWLGFVDDIQSLYAQCDVHLVGNSVATGLRTRIIESFVCGVPVVSVPQAAAGIIGLKQGKNILLADSPEGFAEHLVRLMQEPECLTALAECGRALYDQFYSRKIAAETLRHLLEKYIKAK